jgi:hypothetical protein
MASNNETKHLHLFYFKAFWNLSASTTFFAGKEHDGTSLTSSTITGAAYFHD